MRYKRRAVRGLVLATVMTVILIGTAFALVRITREVSATVSVQLLLQDGIEVYLNEGLTQIADSIDFGIVEVDVFGTARGSVGVPVWIHNRSLSTIRLNLDDDYAPADVVFDGDDQEPFLDPDEVLASVLVLKFHQPAQAGIQPFVVSVNADKPAGGRVNVFGVRLPSDAAPLNQQFLRDFYINEGEALEFAVSVYNPGGGGMQGGFSLAMLSTDLGTVPGSALSWSSSADLKTWTFNIDPDLNWSDGVPVTADDFVYTWQYYADPDHSYDFAWYFRILDVVNFDEVLSGNLALDALGVEAADSKTLVFKLKQGVPYVPKFMMYGSPLAKHQAKKYEPYYNNDPATAISMTPWILSEWIPNQHAKFVPNLNYTGKFRPFIERIVNIKTERFFDAYLGGAIDTVRGPFSPADQFTLMNDPKLLAERGVSQDDFRTHYLFFDFQSPPFDDVRVRQAFAKALDREFIIRNVVGEDTGIPSYGILMDGFPDAVTTELKQYQGLDAQAAQQLLADAGFPNGAGFPKLELALRQETELRQAVAAAVALELKKNLNIDVTINNMDRKAFMAALNKQELPFAMISYGFDYVDASNFLNVFKTDGRHNWNDAGFEQLLNTARGNPDVVERSQQMAELQNILSERVGSVFLWSEIQNQLHKPYLKGTWRDRNQAGWEGLQFPNWEPGFGAQNIYTVYIGDNVKDFDRPPF